MDFQPYPFEKLNNLFLHIESESRLKELSLTIGEPQFETPEFIQEVLKNNTHLLNKYPKIAGEQILRDSQIDFVKRRFGVELKQNELVTTLGTRESLFNLPQFLLFDKQNPIMAYPNPFYQIYEGAAIASRAKSVYLNLTEENDFKPSIDEEVLKKCDLVILNSPSNPTASVMNMDELKAWVLLALKYNFILINDECYSEIYTKTPPHSLLEACLAAGNRDFKNILVLNSISKRSCAPSLRSGFVAGDAKLLLGYARYRTYAGCAAPLPIQLAAAAAWSNERHVEKTRQKYIKNFEIAKSLLGTPISEATFYIWFKVENDEIFAKELYEKKGVKTLPGSYLSREKIGKEYVRMALVLDEDDTKEALQRIADFQKGI
ncbi:MAG: succinyldiaminopimelate transaminase [Campylobacteraceae bacterium]|jgi:aspartate/methionine/tyrosine aminotransferase|nr:succinyldiaminopimelate transaminase [Campylobacteraceae bacterium]